MVWSRQTDGDCLERPNELSIGLDCCIKKTKFEGIFLVQTTDFFFPLINDPYMMGKIACANVLSDLFAMGVIECDNMLMLMGVSTDMNEKEREVVVPLLMKGFRDCAKEIGTTIMGGQTVKNPWMLIGGVASCVVGKKELIPYNMAEVGDVLVLTKPLGTRLVVNAYQWYDQKMDRFDKIKHLLSISQLSELYIDTAQQMCKLNYKAAKEMRDHNVKCCTDVTGFGIVGHAHNLASFQLMAVDFVIHTLPLIKYTREISECCGIDYKYLQGECSETSGGLLIVLPSSEGQKFCDKFIDENGEQCAWIVGDVVKGDRSAYISQSFKCLSVNPIK